MRAANVRLAELAGAVNTTLYRLYGLAAGPVVLNSMALPLLAQCSEALKSLGVPPSVARYQHSTYAVPLTSVSDCVS